MEPEMSSTWQPPLKTSVSSPNSFQIQRERRKHFTYRKSQSAQIRDFFNGIGPLKTQGVVQRMAGIEIKPSAKGVPV